MWNVHVPARHRYDGLSRRDYFTARTYRLGGADTAVLAVYGIKASAPRTPKPLYPSRQSMGLSLRVGAPPLQRARTLAVGPRQMKHFIEQHFEPGALLVCSVRRKLEKQIAPVNHLAISST